MADELQIRMHGGDSLRDSESSSYCGCSITDTSNSVFCTDCQQHGYTQFLQGTAGVSRGHHPASRLESDDSGIRIPANSISDDGENEKKIVPAYLQVISGSKVSIAADLMDGSSRHSSCSYCPVECEETHVKQSVLSLCSNCKALEHPGADTTHRPTVKDGAPQAVCGSCYYNLGRRKPLPEGLQLNCQGETSQHKHKLEQLDSHDSGIRMNSVDADETWECKTLHNGANDVDYVPSLTSGLTKPAKGMEDHIGSHIAHCQLSAHPKNRALFKYLGFDESDV